MLAAIAALAPAASAGEATVRTLRINATGFVKNSAVVDSMMSDGHGGLYLSGNARRQREDIGWFFVAHVDARGRLDRRFGRNGVAKYTTKRGDPFYETRVSPGPNGSIQVSGLIMSWDYSGDEEASEEFDMALVRFTSRGVLDRKFGNRGAKFYAQDFGKGAFLERTTFSAPGGKLFARGRNCQPDLADGATFPCIARVDRAGQLDSTFGDHGFALIGTGHPGELPGSSVLGVLSKSDGSTLVTGSTTRNDHGHTYVAKLSADGRPDLGFGAGGAVVDENPGRGDSSTGAALAAAPSGRSYLVSTINRRGHSGGDGFRIRRLLADGATDKSFGNSGLVSDESVAHLDPSNWNRTVGAASSSRALYVAAWAKNRLALRAFNADGQRRNAFGRAGRVNVRDCNGSSIAGPVVSRGRVFAVCNKYGGGRGQIKFVSARG